LGWDILRKQDMPKNAKVATHPDINRLTAAEMSFLSSIDKN
jgi:hypothetical protein